MGFNLPRRRPCWPWPSRSGPEELCRLLWLPPECAAEAEQAARDSPCWSPALTWRGFAPGNPNDPLLLQILPRGQERAADEGFVADPVGEADAGRNHFCCGSTAAESSW